EGQKLQVHASAAVRKSLSEGLSLDSAMASFSGLEWKLPSPEISPLRNANGSESGLLYQIIPLAGLPPRFARAEQKPSREQVIGYRFLDPKTGGRLLFLPDVAKMEDQLRSEIDNCDLLLFDGTFWS